MDKERYTGATYACAISTLALVLFDPQWLAVLPCMAGFYFAWRASQ
jgi:hypothetical protein